MAQRHVLDGYKVIDFTHAVAGPSGTRMLAEMGAEVIKVEFAPDGDLTRMMPWMQNGRSGYFLQQNRGKKSLCLNPKTPEGLEILKDLLRSADVFVENYSPGVMARMGLGWEVVHELNPRLVMCSVSAFGQTGPLSHLPGYDYIAASYTGILDNIGYPDGPPLLTGMAMGDVSTGVNAYAAIVTALLDRARTNEGQYLDITLLDTYMHMHELNVQAYTGSKGAMENTRFGHLHATVAPVGVFKGREGYIFILSVPKDWPMFCKVIGREDLIEHPDYATLEARAKNRYALADIIQAWCASQPSDDAIINKFREAHLPVAPVLSISQALAEPHLIEREVAQHDDDRGMGNWQFPRIPIRLSKHPERPELLAPFLGEHNEYVLQKHLGYSAGKIADLHASGVLHALPLPEGMKVAQ
ncbi:MAG: CoA transferase [Alphaproteobacteria bacterium]|nr:CoA transferase [Alphaproteobacteria bacterium]